MKKKLLFITLFMGLLCLLICGCGSHPSDQGAASSQSKKEGEETSSSAAVAEPLQVKDGAMQPILKYTSPWSQDYTNKGSDILRFCVYVESDYDTDGDGKNDLVKAFVQVPRPAAEGKFKAGVIYDPTPYSVGVVQENSNGCERLYIEKPFDYKKLYKKGEQRKPAGHISTLKAAAQANPSSWFYPIPNNPNQTSYSYEKYNSYYLVRGFALVQAAGIGTYGSEGFELCGMDLERDSHKAVVEWLTGDRKAFTDPDSNVEIKADWSNGKVAMTGCSYGGTLPFEVATTGVKGLETIIPYAGIACWYDYTNSQGVSIINEVHYADYLASFNSGGTYLDKDWTVPNDDYCSFLWQLSSDQEKTNGDYAPIWEISDYSEDYDNINCTALLVHGLNDFNVCTKQCDLMAQAFQAAGKPYKMVLYQDGHNIPNGIMMNGILWEETVNRWLSHYLYGVDNDIEDMAPVTVQSNVDGSFKTYDSWRDFNYSNLKVQFEQKETEVSSHGLAKYSYDFLSENKSDLEKVEPRENFYLNMDQENAASYEIDMPENGTIYGVPEIHLKLKTKYTNLDGLMISAILMDTTENGEPFKAYMLKDRLSRILPKKITGHYKMGEGCPQSDLMEYVMSTTKGKYVTGGWTDLNNPGLGYKAKEYSKSTDLEADKYYDYTFYLQPTVYTLEKGHKLKLILMTWDPFRAFLDEDFTLNPEDPGQVSEYDYSFTIDNAAIDVRMPLADH